MLYFSFFHSHINYCYIIWGSTYHSNIKCIQILQNKCMSAIYKLDNKTNIDYIFLRHNILKFKDIINISIYKYIFRIYNKHYLHSSICKLFTYNCYLYTFRLNRTFLIPKIRFDMINLVFVTKAHIYGILLYYLIYLYTILEFLISVIN